MGRENKIILLIIASSTLSIIEAFRFVSLYHYSIPFWDQWGYLTPYFENSSWIDGLLFQQGSHFLGLGYFTSLLTGQLFNFSMAGEGYLVAILMLVNALLTIGLKKKISGSLHWFDALIPPLFVYLGFSEIFIHLAYAPVVTLPLMSSLMFAHFLLISNVTKKYIFITILFTLSIFTGYAFITSAIILAYTLLQLITSQQRKQALISLVFQLLVILFFIMHYEVPQSSICLINAGDRPYFQYWLHLVVNSFGGENRLRDIALIICSFTFPVALVISKFKSVAFSRFLPLLALFCFSGGYSILNTLSRACMGVETAGAPRYGAFLLLAIMSVYLLFSMILAQHKARLYIAALVFFGCVFFLKFHRINQFYTSAEKNKARIENWTKCYELHQSMDRCNGPELKNPFAPSQYDRANGFLRSYNELTGN